MEVEAVEEKTEEDRRRSKSKATLTSTTCSLFPCEEIDGVHENDDDDEDDAGDA